MDALTGRAIAGLGAVALLVALAACAPGAAAAGRPACRTEPAEADPAAGIHAGWDRLLRAFVTDGAVDYGCFKEHEGDLNAYLARLDATDPESLDAAGAKAFWINAYNAFTVKLILDHYPGIGGIKEIPRRERWLAKRWRVGGALVSLDEIEHEILRPRFADPRIHFAIVCASRSCPDLASEAYLPDKIDEQLDGAARRFLRDPEKGARTGMARGWLGGARPTLFLSPIFKWFAGDFEQAAGGVVPFVLPFLSAEDRAFAERHLSELAVSYMDYDWSLNGR